MQGTKCQWRNSCAIAKDPMTLHIFLKLQRIHHLQRASGCSDTKTHMPCSLPATIIFIWLECRPLTGSKEIGAGSQQSMDWISVCKRMKGGACQTQLASTAQGNVCQRT
eukprot:scaffold3438_cov17-Tisochrysis_lutea.AAC.1